MSRSCPPSEDSGICRGVGSWSGLKVGPAGASGDVSRSGALADSTCKLWAVVTVGTWNRTGGPPPPPPVRWLQPPPGVPRPALTVGRELKGWELGRGQWGASGQRGGLAGGLAGRGCQGFIRGPGGRGGGISVTGSFLPLPSLVSASVSAFPSLPQSCPASPYLPLAFSFSGSL